MSNSNGDIRTSEEILKLCKKEREDFIEIKEEELTEVQGMNRHERRKWHKLNKNKRKKFD